MTIGIFIAGVLVTLVVAFALVIVIWGAIMDGRDRPASYVAADPLVGPPVYVPPADEAETFEPVPGRSRVGLDPAKRGAVKAG